MIIAQKTILIKDNKESQLGNSEYDAICDILDSIDLVGIVQQKLEEVGYQQVTTVIAA